MEGWYSVGIHPWYIASFAASLNDSKARFEELLDHPQVLAVGEAGLDKLAEAPLTLQIEVFEYQARLAEEADKPLIIHLVKAVDELLKLKQKDTTGETVDYSRVSWKSGSCRRISPTWFLSFFRREISGGSVVYNAV